MNQPAPTNTDPPSKAFDWKWLIKLFVRVAIILAVIWFIKGHVSTAAEQLKKYEFSLASVNYGWFAGAGGFYLLGMIPSWWFWHTTLHAMGARPTWRESCRAFFIGHLGKYVPGKALVVVIRTSMVRSPRTNTTVAAVAVFIETLSLMAVGAAVAAGLIAVLFHDQTFALAVALGLMLCAGIPTLPPIFRRVVRFLKVKKANPEIEQALEGVDFRLMAIGWAALLIECFCFGLSMYAAMIAIPTLTPDGVSFVGHIALLTAAVTLAMVAGFMSLLPGGVGVREALLIALLGGPFGEAAAVVGAILLRLAWLVTEVAISIILYLAIRPPPQEE